MKALVVSEWGQWGKIFFCQLHLYITDLHDIYRHGSTLVSNGKPRPPNLIVYYFIPCSKSYFFYLGHFSEFDPSAVIFLRPCAFPLPPPKAYPCLPQSR